MTPNVLLQSLATALRASDAALVEWCRLGGGTATASDVAGYRAADDVTCPNEVLAQILNGMVLDRRGPRPDGSSAPLESDVTTNVVLKKVRAAFALKDEDVAGILAAAGVEATKSERAAWFRHRDDPHFRPCPDAALQKFLAGLNR